MSGITYTFQCDLCGKDIRGPFAPEPLHGRATADNSTPQACYSCSRAYKQMDGGNGKVEDRESKAVLAAQRLAAIRGRRNEPEPELEPIEVNQVEDVWGDHSEDDISAVSDEEEEMYHRLRERRARTSRREPAPRIEPVRSRLLQAMETAEQCYRDLIQAEKDLDEAKAQCRRTRESYEMAEERVDRELDTRDQRRGKRASVANSRRPPLR